MDSKNKCVQDTNDSSIVSKWSMASQNYFQDEFLKFFTVKKQRRSPLINRGYYLRAMAIDLVLKKFINFPHKNFQIISCGAGFDTSFFRLSQLGLIRKNCRYIEIDLERVVEKKVNIIKQNAALHNLLVDSTYTSNSIQSNGYLLLECDLGDTDKLKEVLDKSEINYSIPTLILSECVITYMPEFKSTRLISFFSEVFVNGLLVVYEQIHPEDGFGQVMKKHFKKIQSPLLSLDKYRNLEEQKCRYLQNGWEKCEVIGMNDFYQNVICSDERRRIESLEPFDEFEEWNSKCSHYILIVAAKTSLLSVIYNSLWLERTPQMSSRIRMQWSFLDSKFCRYGHAQVALSNALYIYCFGGFGTSLDSLTHQRLSEVVCIDTNNGDVTKCNVHFSSNVNKHCFSIMHGQIQLVSENELYLFGGRTSPSTCFNDLYKITFHYNLFDLYVEKVASNISPSGRYRHSLSYISDGIQNFLILIGGRSCDSILNDIHIFDLSSGDWRKVDINIPPMFSHSVCVWNDVLVISGGLSSDFIPSSDMYLFNPFKLEMSKLDFKIIPRYSHTSIVIKENLFLIGGVNLDSECLPGLGVYDLVSGRHLEFSLPPQDSENPVILHNHTSFYSRENDELVVLGGGGNCFSFGTSFNKSMIKIPLSQISDEIM